MKANKKYYSIGEVSKILGIKEHTIRFWNSKLPDLSKVSEKGKTRFFGLNHISKISKINDLLTNNNSIDLALKIISKEKTSTTNEFSHKNKTSKFYSLTDYKKIRNISNNLKNLITPK